MEIYSGKNSDGKRETDVGRKVVLRLVECLSQDYRVVADNFFMSVSLGIVILRIFFLITNFYINLLLALDLLKKNLSVLGTLRKNKADIPKEMAEGKKRKINSIRYCFSGLLNLTSFSPKKDKVVLMLSTEQIQIEAHENGKPSTINLYNKEKNGVDGLDKKISAFTCVRSTRKWPQRIFQNLIDISIVNGHIVYSEILRNKSIPPIKRSLYMSNLILELIEPQIRERQSVHLIASYKPKLEQLKTKIDSLMSDYEAYIPMNRIDTSSPLDNVLNDSSHTLNLPNSKPARKQCVDCSKKRETQLRCSQCLKPKCLSHLVAKYTCSNCLKKQII